MGSCRILLGLFHGWLVRMYGSKTESILRSRGLDCRNKPLPEIIAADLYLEPPDFAPSCYWAHSPACKLANLHTRPVKEVLSPATSSS